MSTAYHLVNQQSRYFKIHKVPLSNYHFVVSFYLLKYCLRMPDCASPFEPGAKRGSLSRSLNIFGNRGSNGRITESIDTSTKGVEILKYGYRI
jgi:hypothetical protein